MKKYSLFSFIFVLFLSPMVLYAKISNYNQFPTMQPSHILDGKLNNISFALGMRVLVSDYNGPVIRLRRVSDNAEQDFGWGDDDKVDISAINSWRNGADVFVHIWYDQSGLGRNAVQDITNQQPKFYPHPNNPYFQGDGSNDHLTVDTPNGIQDVTNKGNEGTVLSVMRATTKAQHTFGVLTGSNRWSSHINWVNNNVYFDPGVCCNNPRFFENATYVNQWVHYTFIKTNTHAIARVDSVEKLNGTHTTGRCTRKEDFAIGWATGNETRGHSTASFLEFIMYKTDIDISHYQEIEENAITYWSL